MKTTQEKIEIMQAFVDGKSIEWISDMFPEWQEMIKRPSWNWACLDYRIKQTSPLIIPWDAIKPEYKWAAKDENERVYVYTEKPFTERDGRFWLNSGEHRALDVLNGVQDPDNIGWKESLIQRPMA